MFSFSLKIWLSLAYITWRMPTITVERRLLKAAVPVNTSKRGISSQLLLCCLCCKSGWKRKQWYYVGTPGGGVLPYNRLMGMCRWMGSHFHDRDDYNGIAFSIELLEWGRKFSDLGVSSDSKWEDSRLKKSESCCLLNLTISLHWSHYIPFLKPHW